MTKIAIILLNWKGTEDTIECIDSIAAQPDQSAFRTIVVDNASGDGSPDRIAEHCEAGGISYERQSFDSKLEQFKKPHSQKSPAVTIVESDTNLGFCVGNNLGASLAFEIGADAAFILNNDTTVAPDIIAQLTEAFKTLGPHMLISPQILYADEPDYIWWFGGYFSRMLMPSYGHQGEKRRSDEGHPETEWVSGCATLISRQLFERIGLYDPIYFIWCEEWDLSLRASNAGIPLRIAPKAIVYHKVGKSLGVISPLTFFYAMRNMIILRQRYLAWPLRTLFWLAFVPRKAIQALIFSRRYNSRRYWEAFTDALTESRGGIWRRQ